MTKRIVLILFLFAALGAAVWAAFRFVRPKWQAQRVAPSGEVSAEAPPETWDQAAEMVKADRGEPAGVNARVEIPPELKHYEERHWNLATQVAEIAKHRLHTVQDYLDLAATIQRGEMITVPALTDSYILFGIGERATDEEFSQNRDDNRKGSIPEDKTQIDEGYSDAETRQHYESLQSLAKNFGGRSFDLNNSTDRQAFKIYMLSSLRPQALKVMEEVASAYHGQFGRRLPVSSLVRPEQYQRALRRVNRNAIMIDTPPHSTGLAFDIDYRYLTAAEQAFVMDELARLKRDGRIEVIRERNANYHVFAFLNGTRPNDDLIAASLEEARGPQQQAHHATAKSSRAKSKKVTKKTVKSRRPRATPKRRRR